MPRHELTPSERSRGGRASGGHFKKGPDVRRHALTREEAARGGHASWRRTMAELRLSMNLPLPDERLRDIAREILAKRRGVA